jgi:hypothetical protein
VSRHSPHHGRGGAFVRDARTGVLHPADSEEAQRLHQAAEDAQVQPVSTDGPEEGGADDAAPESADESGSNRRRRRKRN